MTWIKRFWRTNRFPIDALNKYLRYATKSELIWDIGVPLVVSVLITLWIKHMGAGFHKLVPAVQSINNQVLTAISILAGFSSASLTILVSTDSASIDQLRRQHSARFPDVTLFEMLLSFFQWAIVSQLLIILISILLLFVTSLWTSGHLNWSLSDWEITLGLILWLTAVSHVIMVSLRNLKITITFVLHKDDKK